MPETLLFFTLVFGCSTPLYVAWFLMLEDAFPVTNSPQSPRQG